MRASKITFLAFILLGIIFNSCSDDGQSPVYKKVNDSNNVLKIAQEIGVRHNSELDLYYTKLQEQITNNKVKVSQLRSLNYFFENNNLKDSEEINMYNKITQDVDFKNYISSNSIYNPEYFSKKNVILSEQQKNVLLKLDDIFSKNESLDDENLIPQLNDLEKQVINTFPHNEQSIVLIALEVAKKSSEYWRENAEKMG